MWVNKEQWDEMQKRLKSVEDALDRLRSVMVRVPLDPPYTTITANGKCVVTHGEVSVGDVLSELVVRTGLTARRELSVWHHRQYNDSLNPPKAKVKKR